MSVSLINGHIDDDVQLTDEQIVKALECCLNNNNCSKCPLKNVDCRKKLIDDALNLINRQKAEKETMQSYIDCLKAEIERLEKEVKYWEAETKEARADIDQAVAEAVKEFAERLKEELEGEYIKATNKLENAQNIVVSANIKIVDNLVKEMVGDIDV